MLLSREGGISIKGAVRYKRQFCHRRNSHSQFVPSHGEQRVGWRREHKLQNWCNALVIVTQYSKFRSETATVWLILKYYIGVRVSCYCIIITYYTSFKIIQEWEGGRVVGKGGVKLLDKKS